MHAHSGGGVDRIWWGAHRWEQCGYIYGGVRYYARGAYI